VNTPADVADEIADHLRASSDPGRALQVQAYLKSDLVHFGTSMPQIRAAVRGPGRALSHEDMLDVVRMLWDEAAAAPIFERRMAAAVLLSDRQDILVASDLALIGGLIGQSETWALVDVLVPRPVGRISQREPAATGQVLDQWAREDNFWLRRAALLAHLVPLREGDGDWGRFSGYAEAMLDDREFFIRKAIGWVLRDTARRRPDLVRDWVAPRTDRMSGVTIREAVKRLQPEDRDALMLAYREHRPATIPS